MTKLSHLIHKEPRIYKLVSTIKDNWIVLNYVKTLKFTVVIAFFGVESSLRLASGFDEDLLLLSLPFYCQFGSQQNLQFSHVGLFFFFC